MDLNISVFPLDDFLGHIIHCTDMKAAVGLLRTFQDKGYNITPGHYIILTILWEQEGIHQSALADSTLKDRHNITRMLNLLEKNGYIKREIDPSDKRIFRIYLTETGKALKQEVTQVVSEYFKKCFAG